MPRARPAIVVKCLILLLILLATTRDGFVVVQKYLAGHRPGAALAMLGIWAACLACTWCAALLPSLAARCAWARVLASGGIFRVFGSEISWNSFRFFGKPLKT